MSKYILNNRYQVNVLEHIIRNISVGPQMEC